MDLVTWGAVAAGLDGTSNPLVRAEPELDYRGVK
jgi:hypothetical protein